MSNPSRRRGTNGENFWQTFLRALHYPDVPDGGVLDLEHPLQRLDNVERHGRSWDGDYVGTPWMTEAKATKKPLFLQWRRVLQRKATARDDFKWVLLWTGDRRTEDGQPLVVMTPVMYAYLVHGDHLK